MSEFIRQQEQTRSGSSRIGLRGRQRFAFLFGGLMFLNQLVNLACQQTPTVPVNVEFGHTDKWEGKYLPLIHKSGTPPESFRGESSSVIQGKQAKCPEPHREGIKFYNLVKGTCLINGQPNGQ